MTKSSNFLRPEDSEGKVDVRFLKGLELFNEKEFFECHEAIEGLWLETKGGEYNDLYQGVIQAASAIYQFKRGYLGGAHRLFESSVGHLEKYQPVTLGLNVEKLIQDMKTFFEVYEGWDGKKELVIAPSLIPFLEYSG